jgi:P pilus assembly chaperone PapD
MKSSELTKLVSVSSNDYQKVAFGGIRNLQLTVNNDSKYILDNVTVEVQYLKPSEEPLRTESVQFRSVAPGGTMTVRMPDTNRGIKVTYKITNILSTQSAKETAGL